VVENTAHYITPAGAKLVEADRMALIAEGFWTPTAHAVPWKRGYRVTRMMTPFPTGNFGNMARAFLEAKRKQDSGQFDENGRAPLRVFVYERLAEKFYSEKKVPEMTEIDSRRSEYDAGARMSVSKPYKPFYIGKRTLILLSADVQQACEWWVAREWVDGGDSGLLEIGQSHGLADLREIGIRIKPIGVLIDNSYTERAREVIEAASAGMLKGAIITYGRDNLRDKHGAPREYDAHLGMDPYEGTANQGRYKCNSVTFLPDLLKNQLYALTNGENWHKWRVPREVPEWYVMQMTAEQSIDGHWTKIRRDNHAWDCEVLQLLGAKLYGVWRDAQPVMAHGEATEPAPVTPQEPQAPVKKTDPAAPMCPANHGPMEWDGKRYWRCRKCGGAREGAAPKRDVLNDPEDDDE
jgi:hypothetical protein